MLWVHKLQHFYTTGFVQLSIAFVAAASWLHVMAWDIRIPRPLVACCVDTSAFASPN